MKSHRYQQPDRHLEHDLENPTVNDSYNPQPNHDANANAPFGVGEVNEPSPTQLEVDVGNAMPPSQVSSLPVVAPVESGSTRSLLAEGMRFVGNAELRGPCSIGGHVEGNIKQAPGAQVAVVVTETGRVKGDITAHKISVMGHTDGILDSGEGEVSLHDTASVHGLVRYGRIQVNGADLNATLERAVARKPVS